MEITTDELSLLPVLLYLLTIVPHHQGGRGQNVALHSWNRSWHRAIVFGTNAGSICAELELDTRAGKERNRV